MGDTDFVSNSMVTIVLEIVTVSLKEYDFMNVISIQQTPLFTGNLLRRASVKVGTRCMLSLRSIVKLPV